MGERPSDQKQGFTRRRPNGINKYNYPVGPSMTLMQKSAVSNSDFINFVQRFGRPSEVKTEFCVAKHKGVNT